MHRFKTRGTCSREIIFDVKDNKLTDVNFISGCNGNLKGISALVEGMPIDEVIDKLKDIKCGDKNTSCPAQLADAVKEYKEKMNY